MNELNPWLGLAISVGFGALAGGVTNWVAVWMLFHPYERRYGFQGAIPKNKPRLAKSIGRTVGERLLTPEDILNELGRSGLRDTFDMKVAELVASALDEERPSIHDLLPPAVLAEVERAVAELAPRLAERLGAFVESPEFAIRTRDFVARMRTEIADRPLGEVLTPERRTALRARAVTWSEELAQSEELERGVREYIARHAEALLSSPEPMLERIPIPLVEALERAIAAYLPMAADRIGSFLSRPTSRERIREALHGLFQRFVTDLYFHERVIARLVVTERTFEKVIDSLERDGVDQLASLLQEPAVRDEMARTINHTIVEYLRRPMADLVGGADSERHRAMATTLGDYVVRVLRAESTRGFLIDKLDDVLQRAEHRTWGELLGAVDDETIAAWITTASRSPQAREWAEHTVQLAASRALTRPLGRIGRWLPEDGAERLTRAVAPALWGWIRTQLPVLVQRFDIPSVVERKVLGFSVQRMEEIILGVTKRELDLIVRLGFPLGAMIGLMSFVFSRLASMLLL